MTHRPSVGEIERWLIERIATLTASPLDSIDPDRPMEGYGLTSVMAVGMSADLEDWLEIAVEATIVWDYPTVATLAQHLADSAVAGKTQRAT
jgi:acyl carrier protein